MGPVQKSQMRGAVRSARERSVETMDAVVSAVSARRVLLSARKTGFVSRLPASRTARASNAVTMGVPAVADSVWSRRNAMKPVFVL